MRRPSIRSIPPDSGKIVPVAKLPKIRCLEDVVKEGKIMAGNGLRWEDISVDLGLTTVDGRPDPGMAYRIVKQGYRPKRISTQIRLGIAPICPTCHRPLHEKRKRRRRSLLDYPDKELKAMFENRQEY